MTEKIIHPCVWDVLSQTPLPIVLYGMGDGADMVIDRLRESGRDFDDVFASDAFVRGQSFRGKRVKTYAEICERYGDFFIVMCFASRDKDTIDFVTAAAREHPLVAPDVPVADKDVFTYDFIKEHDGEFDKAFSLLADERSRQNYIDILNFKISGRVDLLFKAQQDKAFVYDNILINGDDEAFVDLGAYDGDTVNEFVTACNGKYRKIFAFEADEKNYSKLVKNTKGLKNTELFNIAAWDKKETLLFEKRKGRSSKLSSSGNVSVQADRLDDIINEEISILKMDIEGSEERAIAGSAGLIKKYRPKLYICAYHRNSDMFALPLKINEICNDYRFYFYHHMYIPAWESNFYGVVK